MNLNLMHDVGKGEKRRFDTAVHEHLQFCERSMKRTAYKYPWQMGFLGDNNKESFPFGPVGMSPLCRVPVLQDTLQDLIDRRAFLMSTAENCFADFRRLSGMHFWILSAMQR